MHRLLDKTPRPTLSGTYKTPESCSTSISHSHSDETLFSSPVSMDSSTLPRLLPPLPSLHRQQHYRPHHPKTVPRHGNGRMPPAAARVKTGRGGRDAGKFRAQGLFGDGGGDGLRTVMRMVKLNSAIQNRSVRELLELLGDECLYFFGNLRSVDVPQLGKVKRADGPAFLTKLLQS